MKVQGPGELTSETHERWLPFDCLSSWLASSRLRSQSCRLVTQLQVPIAQTAEVDRK